MKELQVSDALNHLPCEEVSCSLAVAESHHVTSLEGNNSLANDAAEIPSEVVEDTSAYSSNEEVSDNEELSHLLRRYYAKIEDDNLTPSAEADKDTAEDIKKEAESEPEESDADFPYSLQCDAKTLPEPDLNSTFHPGNTRQRNKCPLCGRVFGRSHDLRRHLDRIHNIKTDLQCTHCETTFDSKFELARHIRNAHGNGKYQCDACDYATPRLQHLKQHISAVHLEEKPHKCDQCDACFSKKSNLAMHVRLVHNHEKPYECSVCDKKFTTRQKCVHHWRSTHCGEKPFICDLCKYRFASKCNLKLHQRTVHDGTRQYVCSYCEYKGATKEYLKRHVVAVHYQMEPHLCNECGKAFTDKSSVRRHANAVHKGIKPHACAACALSFSRSSSLQRHIQAVHFKNNSQSTISPMSEELCVKL